jgi:hypothetical protein
MVKMEESVRKLLFPLNNLILLLLTSMESIQTNSDFIAISRMIHLYLHTTFVSTEIC